MSSHGLETSVLTDVALPAVLAVLMFGMGLTLVAADFRRLRERPRAVAVGLAGQLLVLPALAVVVAVAFHALGGFATPLVLGLVLLACCPGGATSNLLAYLARADAALSVTLTSITSLLAAVTTPVAFLVATSVLFGQATQVSVSFAQMGLLVLAIVALPIVAGMALRARRPAWAARAEGPFRKASVVLLALVVAGVIWQNRADFWALAALAVPASLALNALALGAGILLGRLARLGQASSRAISIEVGFQNGTLAIALAVTQLGSPQAAIVPGFYSLVMLLTGGALAWRWGRQHALRVGDRSVVTQPVEQA